VNRIRVLVVDDALLVRRIVTDVLAADPEIEVVGTAANGRAALAKVDQLHPDLVTLDIEMPEMDGLEALSHLRRTHPTLPVIMFSTLTQRGAASTLEALARGASDYVTKPSSTGGVAEGLAQVRAELVPRIKALHARTLERQARRAARQAGGNAVPATDPSPRPATTHRPPDAAAVPATARRDPRPVDVIAIGVSTGGPTALAHILPTLPADLPVPVVVVQHMPAVFTSLLAQRLDATAALRVVEADAGMALEPGTVFLAPGGERHMQVRRDGTAVRIALADSPPEHSCRPAVDALFRSVAAVYGARALAVVLTGMGFDGSGAAPALHAAGARILVQDEDTSVVWGMPGAIARAGLADDVLSLADIGPALVRHAIAGRRASPPVATNLSGR